MGILSDDDRRLQQLRERHPGWRLWTVPRVGAHTVWCGHRLPVLNEDSAEHLDEAIKRVEEADLTGR